MKKRSANQRFSKTTHKGGGDNMAGSEVALEVERVMNLIRGFGWEKREEKLEADKVILVIEKKVAVPAPATPT